MARVRIDFDGFDKAIEEFERREKDLRSTVEKALEETFDVITPKLKQTLPPHRYSGDMEESFIDKPAVVWTGNVAEVKVGFDLSKDVASQFLIYGAKASVKGTPYRPPDMKMWNILFGSATKKEIAEVQREVFERELL